MTTIKGILTCVALITLSTFASLSDNVKKDPRLLLSLSKEFDLIVEALLVEGQLTVAQVIRGDPAQATRQVKSLNSGSYPKLLEKTGRGGCLILRSGFRVGKLNATTRICPIRNGVLLYKEKEYKWDAVLRDWQHHLNHKDGKRE